MRTFYRGVLAALAIVTIGGAGAILGTRLFLDQPRVHVIQNGEYLSDLAKTYYGDADYWRALALVNRVPDANRIYPGEHIVLPSLAAIQEISATNRFSIVNEIMSEQLTMASLETEQEAAAFAGRTANEIPAQSASGAETEIPAVAETETMLEESEPFTPQSGETGLPAESIVTPGAVPDEGLNESVVESGATSSGLFWPLVLGISTVLFGAVFVLYRRQKNAEDDSELEASPIDDAEFEKPRSVALKPIDNTWNEDPEPVSDDEIFRPVSGNNRALKGAYL